MPKVTQRPSPASPAADGETSPADKPLPEGPLLAVNVQDLAKLDPLIRKQILTTPTGSRLDLARGAVVTSTENPARNAALVFCCPLLEAAVTCDVLTAAGKKLTGAPLKLYLYRNGVWTKLPAGVAVSKSTEADVVLNPKLFPESLTVSIPARDSGPKEVEF